MSFKLISVNPIAAVLLALLCSATVFAQEISMDGWDVNATNDSVTFMSPLGIRGSNEGTSTVFELPEGTLIKTHAEDGSLSFFRTRSFKAEAVPINGSVGGQQFVGGEISTNSEGDTGILLREGGLFFCDLWGGLMNKIDSPEGIPFSIKLENGSIMENLTSVSFL